MANDTKINIRIPQELYERITATAVRFDVTVSEIARACFLSGSPLVEERPELFFGLNFTRPED